MERSISNLQIGYNFVSPVKIQNELLFKCVRLSQLFRHYIRCTQSFIHVGRALSLPGFFDESQMRCRILIPKICVRSRPTPRRPRRERLPVANPSQTIRPLVPYEFTYIRDSNYIRNICGQKYINSFGNGTYKIC